MSPRGLYWLVYKVQRARLESMLPSSHKPLRQRRQAGINIKQSICLVVAAAALFLLTATILYGTMPEHQSLSHLRHTASGLATAAKSKVTAAKSAAANTAAAAAAATGSVLTNAASSAKQAVRSGANSVSRFAERGKINRARALAECKDQQATCAQWAHAGECTNNPGFMRPNCPKSCDACLDSLKRQELCHRPRSRMPLLRRGGVDATFERLLEQMAAEGFVVHTPSRPPTGPWVVYIDDFLAEHEIRASAALGPRSYACMRPPLSAIRPLATFSSALDAWLLSGPYCLRAAHPLTLFPLGGSTPRVRRGSHGKGRPPL